MAIGYANNGVDFDDVFEPLTGTKRANIGYQLNGVDISNFYEPASSGTPASNVGYRINGTDIGPLFAAKGGVVYWDGTLAPLGTSYSDNGNITTRDALVEIIFGSNGEIRLRKNYPSADETVLGDWDGTAATGSNTEVRFVLVSGDTLTTNGATNFSSLTANRSFSLRTGAGFLFSSVRVELRNTGDSSTTITKEVSITVSHTG